MLPAPLADQRLSMNNATHGEAKLASLRERPGMSYGVVRASTGANVGGTVAGAMANVKRCPRGINIEHRALSSRSRSRQEPLNNLDHGVVDVTVGGDDVASARTERTARQIGHAAAGLLDDQRAGRDVPGMKRLLPEPVEPARGDVAEIDGRRAETPDRARHFEELAEQPNERIRRRCCTL